MCVFLNRTATLRHICARARARCILAPASCIASYAGAAGAGPDHALRYSARTPGVRTYSCVAPTSLPVHRAVWGRVRLTLAYRTCSWLLTTRPTDDKWVRLIDAFAAVLDSPPSCRRLRITPESSFSSSGTVDVKTVVDHLRPQSAQSVPPLHESSTAPEPPSWQ